MMNPRFRLKRLVLIQCSLWLVPSAFAAAPAPVIPVIAPTTLPIPAANFVGTGSAAIARMPGAPLCSGACLQIDQTSANAILNWRTFNVGSAASVVFNQTDASGKLNANAITLNRVLGSSADPSVILGKITAPGQVYLVNQNGILFGAGAQVNVGGLIASSLAISDDVFNKYGLLGAVGQPSSLPALDFFKDANGLPLSSGDIWVYPGANLTTSSQGHLMLAAPNVHNAGSLHAPDGQVALVAGNRVYVAVDAADPTLRGAWLVAVEGIGVAENLGTLMAERGNVTLAGLTVNQAGTARATTSVNYNGSIYLLAGNQNNTGVPQSSTQTPAQYQLAAKQGGTLTLGSNSVTEVLPDLTDNATTLDAQTFHPSSIRAVGKTIAIESGAQVRAPGGKIEVSAVADPSVLVNPDPAASIAPSADPTVGLYLAPGAVIDASGENGIEVPVTRNFVNVELRGTELQDSPLLRTGPLYGKTVVVDLRRTDSNGNIPIANIAGDLSKVGRTVGERTSVGGAVTLQSEGFLATSKGSTVNVAGGSLAYTPGVASTSQLVGADGRVYDVMNAPAGLAFNGIAGAFNLTSSKWNTTQSWGRLGGSFSSLQPGYVEGKDAGSLTVRAKTSVLEGTLLGGTVTGAMQRDLAAALSTTSTQPSLVRPYTQLAARGQLTLGDTFFALGDLNFATPQDTLSAIGENNILTRGLPATTNAVRLAPDLLSNGGWGSFSATSQGNITLAQGTVLNAPDGAKVSLNTIDQASNIQIAGKIDIASGNVTLAQSPPPAPLNQLNPGTVTLASTGSVELEGRWVNDNPNLSAGNIRLDPRSSNGGSLTIRAARDLVLEAGSLVDVSAGAVLSAGGKVTAGKAGSVTLQSGALAFGSASLTPALLRTDGTLMGYGLNKGGTLTIQAPALEIGRGLGETRGHFGVSPEFFSIGGFSSYALTGHDGVLIDANTQIDVVANNLLLNVNAAGQAGSRHLADVASIGRLPDGQRSPGNISLNADRTPPSVAGAGAFNVGDFNMNQGASISTEAGGSISLAAGHSMWVDGSLLAPSGKINLAITGPTAGGTGDPGYDPTQALWVGPQARLLAPGYAQVVADSAGLRSGSVFDAGTIALSATRGSLIVEAGSVIDVKGTSAVLDINAAAGAGISRQPSLVYGSAGTVLLAAREGMLVEGTLQGNPALATAASGGTLSLQVDRAEGVGATPNALPSGDLVANPYPALSASPTSELVDRVLQVDATANTTLAPGVHFGSSIAFQTGGNVTSANGVAYFNAAALAAGGFDSLNLKARNRVQFGQGTDLVARKVITIDAPLIGLTGLANNSSVTANYAEIGNLDAGYQSLAPSSVTGGTGTLTIKANALDVVGNFGLQGLTKTQLISQGDIRLSGVVPLATLVPNLSKISGSLTTSGTLHFDAAQVYPSTLTNFNIAAAVEVDLVSPGSPPPPPLSAGGRIAISAPVIQQGGVLRAPLGELDLNAAERLTLSGNNSVTSVSAAGLEVPFGVTQNGIAWSYFFDAARSTLIAGLPSKKIQLGGPDVNIASSARVDLSGGGDVFATEFFAGPGGSRDVLAASNLYAILPSLQGNALGPFDPGYAAAGAPAAGSTVTLAGSSLLAPGTYTLLPARYALLPGALAVRIPASPSYTDLVPGQSIAQLDGSLTVAGKRSAGDSGLIDARWQGMTLVPQAVLQSQAQYSLTQGSSFFANQATRSVVSPGPLPGDAGELSVAASRSLALVGQVDLAPLEGGLAGSVAISAQKIAVVDVPQSADPALPGYLEIGAGTLSALKAGNLLLGASRSDSLQGGDSLQITAQSVEIRNSAAQPLQAGALTFAAKDGVAIRAGAVVSSSGTDASASPSSITLNGDGALVRLAPGALPEVNRGSGLTRATGTLVVESGALLDAGIGALTLDATSDSTLSAGARLKAGTFAFAGSQVNLGASSSSSGLALSNAFLAGLSGTQALDLKGYGGINIYGPLNVDLTRAINGGKLVLNAPVISNRGSGDSQFAAAQIVLKNTTGVTPSASTVGGTGNLSLVAQGKAAAGGILLGPGDVQVDGVTSVQMTANQVIGSGQGGLASGGRIAIDTPLISADAAAKTHLSANGSVSLVNLAGSVATPANPGGTAASFTVTGSTVQIDTLIQLPGGNLNIQAATGAVGMGAAGAIKVAGQTTSFGDQKVEVPAGQVHLAASQGDINLAADSSIDVSGAAGGNAGSLELIAPNGDVSLTGRLTGSADAGHAGGIIRIDGGTLNSGTANNKQLTSLTAILEAGGFTERRDVRVRTGDLIVEDLPAASIRAQNVTLTADAGAIGVAGKIDASGASGGTVALWAHGNVSLDGNALILANATATGGNGGDVTLGSSVGAIQFGPSTQARIQEGVPGSGNPGSVLIRAPRIAGGSDVAVGVISGQIQGSGDTVIEATQVYQQPQLDAAFYASVGADTSSFMGNAVSISQRLGVTGDLTTHVRAGVEVQSAGNLTVVDALNLYQSRRPGNEPTALTLRAGGDLQVASSINDGFVTASPNAALSTGPSSTIRLISGADLQAADPMGTAGGSGSVNIAAGSLVRTGSGAIRIAAAGNVNVGDDNGAAAIYTAGVLAPDQTLRTGSMSPTGAAFALPVGVAAAQYTTGGGSIDISAGGSVKGVGLAPDVNQWLYRQGHVVGSAATGGAYFEGRPLTGPQRNSPNPQTSWWVNFATFTDGIGALGQGNVRITAGGDLANLALAIPTNARLPGGRQFYLGNNLANPVTFSEGLPDASKLVELGGGQLSVQVGGNMLGTNVYVQRGTADLVAGGQIAGAAPGTGAVLALGNASVVVDAARGAIIDAVYNPMMAPQAPGNVSNPNLRTSFSTYAGDSALSVFARSGNIVFNDNPAAVSLSGGLSDPVYSTYPPTLHATALNGDINVSGLAQQSLWLYPANQGNLTLFARGSVDLSPGVSMSGLDPANLPGVASPVVDFTGAFSSSLNPPTSTFLAQSLGQTVLHSGDGTPVTVVAAKGDVIGSHNAVSLQTPKAVVVEAGRDLSDVSVFADNLTATDVSRMVAGRDIVFHINRDANNVVTGSSEQIQLGGAGRLSLIAGRDIDLGDSVGVVTTGNTQASALPVGGAAISLAAGLGSNAGVVRPPAYAAFVDRYLDPAGSGFVSAYQAELISYVSGLTGAQVTADQALRTFRTLSPTSQDPLLRNILYTELRDTGRAHTQSGASYDRGYQAIDTLFPAKDATGQSITYLGDVSLYFSQIKTAQGGNIDLLVPGGLVNAGLANPPSGARAKQPDTLGILSVQGGSVDAMTSGSFLVNSSRVFTLAGGDIMLWSSNGSIDAGRGAKSTVLVPPPVVTVDPKTGNVSTVLQLPTGGGGIGTLITKLDQPLGNVDLIAPQGSVNAGDAGIRVSGNLNIAAPVVIGGDNIKVGGAATGVPVADTTGLSQGLASNSVSQQDGGKSNSAMAERLADASRQADQLAQSLRPTFVTVEVEEQPDLCADPAKCRK